MSDLVVAEAFGPTFQGEGPSSGRRAAFLRLGRCNLDCSWCDTPYTWDWQGKNGKAYEIAVETERWTIDQAVDTLVAYNAPLVVITGGEPLLQRTALTALVASLRGEALAVEVETNGTLAPLPKALGVGYNVSPKLRNSGVEHRRRYKPEVLAAFDAAGAAFKFVCTDSDDLAEVDAIAAAVPLDRRRIWIMPEARSARRLEAGLSLLAQPVLDRGYNLSSRLHVALWGDARGR